MEIVRALTRRVIGISSAILFCFSSCAFAQETVCAKVKIEIKQELTLERQAFEAEMRINNTTDSGVIENVLVVVKVTDENGTPVAVTTNPNDLTAKFFLRQSNKQNISDTDGNGTVNPKTTSTIDWILIPSPGSAGTSPLGKKYLVGATLQYRYLGESTVLDVAPDVITVKPLPLLTLDYFLPRDVWADDPLTLPIEPAEPFTLGVRVSNNGFAIAKNLKIDSAQPKIIENNQGLLINFVLTGSYVDDAPTQNTLLINFGDVRPNTNRMGRWVMETTLAGRFTEFTAKFSHADELGGALTSLLQATNAHFLIRDVRVDLPGRDTVRDFLAQDGDVIRVYESDGPDTIVTDRSAVATLVATQGAGSNAAYRLTFPPTAGFAFVRLPDPYGGAKALGQVVRSDAKQMLPENVWLSKTRNEQTKKIEYWVNFFDVNSTGVYDSQFQAPPVAALPPVLQFIPDRTTKEKTQVSFLVDASSPGGTPVTIAAAPLPAGAKFTLQAADVATPGLRRAVFDWTPGPGTAGTYLITYTASDGTLSSARSATIRVEAATPPPGPGTPTITAPLSGSQVTTLAPTLSVQTSTAAQDPTTKVQFELYADEAMTRLVASALVDKAGTATAPAPTAWPVPAATLSDNTRYWWRARAFDGTLYSNWVAARFFANLFNDPPDSFNLTSPVPGAEVASLTPALAWTNSADKDGDAITYSVSVYRDSAMTDVAVQVLDLAENPAGSTAWTVPAATPLVNHRTYTWRAVAKDALGAQTPSLPRQFTVNTGNTAPTVPVIVSPLAGAQSTDPSTALIVQNSNDAEGDLLTYVFEIDTVNTFDSAGKRSSGQIIQGGTGTTSWVATGLVENKRYWWRAKAQDGRADSAWVTADFLMNAVNDAPPAPTVRNPGNGAWSATRQPSLEANPVLDPEGDPVRYQFEVYRDASLTQKVADGISATTAFIVPAPLADKTTHWWRVRALDPQDAASAWSATTVLYISTGPYQDPTIALTSPATPIVPTRVVVGGVTRKQVTLRWEGTDPNVEPTIALYYGTSRSGYAGTLIVDGLRQSAGSQSGTYVWDVTSLPVGTYYPYAVIYDAKGVGKAYAPGAVVVSNPTPSGHVVVTSSPNLRVIVGGQTATFNVKLSKAPIAEVTLPISSSIPTTATVAPNSLTFTPQNWAVNQPVVITGKNDCAVQVLRVFQVLTGPAVSTDPDYIGLSGTPVLVVNVPSTINLATTNNNNVRICGLSIVSQRKVDPLTWEYTLKAELTNVGPPARGITARLRNVPLGMQIVDDTLVFGAVGSGESVHSIDTVVLRARFAIPISTFQIGLGFRWDVVVQP